MKGNFHVQFLGEGVAATSPPYPTPREQSLGRLGPTSRQLHPHYDSSLPPPRTRKCPAFGSPRALARASARRRGGLVRRVAGRWPLHGLRAHIQAKNEDEPRIPCQGQKGKTSFNPDSPNFRYSGYIQHPVGDARGSQRDAMTEAGADVRRFLRRRNLPN